MTDKSVVPEGEQWVWWVGNRSSVDDDGTYDIDSASTREAAIQAGLRDTLPGDQFYVIEAIMQPWDDTGDIDDRHAFAETRNRELLTNGPSAHSIQSGGEGGEVA